MKNNMNRLFALLLCVVMLVSVMPSAAFAEESNTYTLLDGVNGNVYQAAAEYDAAKPVMLDTSITKTGYVFAGWYTEDANGTFVPETVTVTKYYKTESSEKSTTSPDFSSGKEYYTKVDSYMPVIANNNFRCMSVAAGATVPDGLYMFPSAPISGSIMNSKLVVGQTYALHVENYYGLRSYLGKSIDELDALMPSGYTGSGVDFPFIPVVLTQQLKDTIVSVYGNGASYAPLCTVDFSILSRTNTNSRSFRSCLYELSSMKTPVTSSTYKTGSTVWYMDETKTEITAAEYNAADPTCSKEVTTSYTGVMLPASAGTNGGRVTRAAAATYAQASMTPSADRGSVTYVAAWVPAAENTVTLNFGDDTTSVPIAYDPSYPAALGTPARYGFEFKGWFDANDNEVTTTPDTAAGPVTFTAKWEALPMATVTFAANGHGTAPEAVVLVVGDKVTAPEGEAWTAGYVLNEGTADAPKNYTFCGWFSDAALTTPYDFNAPVNMDTTVYAKWTYGNYRDSMVLTKSYTDTYTSTADAPVVVNPLGLFRENIEYTITYVSSFNREVGKEGHPDLPNTAITVGEGNDTVTLQLPDFNAENYGIGDYWYKIVETAGNTAGVTYDTTEYYLHLTVANEEGPYGKVGVISYALHTTAPDENGAITDENDKKDSGFNNTYDAGDLAITKKVTGNMGDPDKYFAVKVRFTAPENTVVKGDITYVGGFAGDESHTPYTATAPGTISAGWEGEKEVTVYVKDGTTVSFTNIPDGVTYTVVEESYADDGYVTSYTCDEDDTATNAGVTGSISDPTDQVTITNHKNVDIDVGVIVTSLPFILISVSALAVIVLLLARKRRNTIID